jgi:hypothetical protein
VIKTIVDLKGAKRFKREAGASVEINTNDLDLDISSLTNAKEIFRKMQTTTSYAKNFGEKPKA